MAKIGPDPRLPNDARHPEPAAEQTFAAPVPIVTNRAHTRNRFVMFID
jgi:hypothetical protein